MDSVSGRFYRIAVQHYFQSFKFGSATFGLCDESSPTIQYTGGKGGSNTQSSGYISGAFGGIGGAAEA